MTTAVKKSDATRRRTDPAACDPRTGRPLVLRPSADGWHLLLRPAGEARWYALDRNQIWLAALKANGSGRCRGPLTPKMWAMRYEFLFGARLTVRGSNLFIRPTRWRETLGVPVQALWNMVLKNRRAAELAACLATGTPAASA